MGLLDRLSSVFGGDGGQSADELFRVEEHDDPDEDGPSAEQAASADDATGGAGTTVDDAEALFQSEIDDSGETGAETDSSVDATGGHPGAGSGSAEESTGPAAAARELAGHWPETDLDFTPASLARLDDLVDHQWDGERFREAELGGDAMDDQVFTGLVHRLGSYYGEVLVRHLDGEWIEHDQLGTAVAVSGADGAAAVSNAYHIAADCLTEPSKFALSFDTVADQVGLDRERVSEGGHVVTADTDAVDADLDPPPDSGIGSADAGATSAAGDGADAKAGSEPDDSADAGEEGPDQPGGDRRFEPDEIAVAFREEAADLVEAFPGYDLDYSPASLERLDRLVAEEFAGHDFSDVRLGLSDDGDSLFLTARAMEGGGYLAEVVRQHLGGVWRDDDGVEIVVEGREAEARIDPVAIAADVYRGEDSFAATYDALAGRLSLPGTVGASETAQEPAGEASGDSVEAGEAGADTGGVTGDATEAEPPREAAASFTERYPAYDLDFLPGSLERVDTLAAELTGAPEDVAAGMAAYVGETFVRRYDAEWRREDEDWVVAIGGDDGEPGAVTLRPLVEDAVAGEASIAEVHETVVDRFDLTPNEPAGTTSEPADTDAGKGAGADADTPIEGGDDGDAVIDRIAAKAAVEAAAEDQREPAPEAAVERHRRAAEDLVAGWPSYDLDFSVESLVRLDALVAAEFDASGGDRDYDGDPLSVPEDAQLSIPTDGSVEGFGGYLAELFRRLHDATWRADSEDLLLVVEGPAGTVAFDPQLVAIACFAGESSFVDAYAHVAADAGLEPPLSE